MSIKKVEPIASTQPTSTWLTRNVMNTFGDLQIENTPAPIAWTIAGSDSGGGAGIQADLKVMSAFGIHGCSVITALTAQNTVGVSFSEPVTPIMLRAQLEALATDLPPAAIKIGMLGSAEVCITLSEYLLSLKTAVICDPVLKSTSGDALLNDDALNTFRKKLLPQVTLLTPNLPEATWLAGEKLSVEKTAIKLLKMGPDSILIKGGHAKGNVCSDYWTNGDEAMWISSPRIASNSTHGTGCILSSAIASAIALGQDISQAIITGKTFLNQCLKTPARVGAGYGPMMIEPFRNAEEDCPIIR